MAVIDGPVGNFSYDVLRWVFAAAVRRPVLRRQLVGEVEGRAGVRTRRRRLARLLLSDEALSLVYEDNAAGLGLLLGPAAITSYEPLVLGRAALDVVRAQAGRTMRLGLAQLDQGRSLEDGQGVLLAGLDELKGGQAVIFEQLCDALEVEAAVPELVADPRAGEFRAPELVGRDDDIDRLWSDIAAAAAGYVVVTAGPWAGKTALLAEMISEPPPDMEVLSFFIRAVGRRNTAEHFLDVVNRQLGRLLGRRNESAQDLAGRRAEFEVLWAEAVAAARRSERLVVLVVDGLDEQDQHAEVPISALLPALAGSWARVVVATRPNPQRFPELSTTHPYYVAAGRPLALSPSPAAQAVADLAGEAVTAIARSDYGLTRQLLGLFTVADGPLRAVDLAALVGTDPYSIGGALAGLERNLVGDGSDAQPWELGHVELLRTARTELAKLGSFLEDCEARLDRWADEHHQGAWPADTPPYLLVSYPTMLVRRRLPRRLAWLVSDEYEARVRERLRTRRGLIDAIDTGLSFYTREDMRVERADVWAICMLGLRRIEMLTTTTGIASRLVAGWARLGSWDEVHRLLDQTVTDVELVEAIGAVTTADLTPHAESVLLGHTERVRHPHAKSQALAHIVTGLASQGTITPDILGRAQRLTDSISHPGRRSDALVRLAQALRDQDKATAHDLLRRAEQATDTIQDPVDKSGVLVRVAEALPYHNAHAAGDVLSRAELAANSVQTSEDRAMCLVDVAGGVAAQASDDPNALAHALRIVDRIEDARETSRALLKIMVHLVVKARANTETMALAEQIEERVNDLFERQQAWLEIAESPVLSSRSIFRHALARAKQLSYDIQDPYEKVYALTALAHTPVFDDTDAAQAALVTAEETAQCIDDELLRDHALHRIVIALAAQSSHDMTAFEHAKDLVNAIDDPVVKGQALADLATATPNDVNTAPDMLRLAEQTAELAGPPWADSWTLIAIVEALATDYSGDGNSNSARASQIADAIEDPQTKSKAWATIATAAATSDLIAAQNAVARAQSAAANIKDLLGSLDALTSIAEALASYNPDAARETLANAQVIADTIKDPQKRCRAGMAIARPMSTIDTEAAQLLLTHAHRAAENIMEEYERDWTLEDIVETLAALEPSNPNILAQARDVTSTIEDPTISRRALLAIAHAEVHGDHLTAHEAITHVQDVIDS